MLPSNFNSKRASHRNDRGYMLLYLMFLALSLVTILPTLKFVIRRDREQEMVHRGEQYRRAIRRYYRKMGAYPPSLDLLESSNDIRFLRKRYKDPVTGKDFKTLTQTDLLKAMGTSLSGAGGIPGAQTLGQPIGGGLNSSGSGDASGTTDTTQVAANPGSTDPNAAGGAQPPAGGDPSTKSPLPFTTISGQPTGQIIGGGALVGVASISEDETIRIYNKKNHYKDWLFIYDPTGDRGGLLVGPYQPTLQTFSQGLNGQNINPTGLGPGMNSGMNSGMGSGMNTPGSSPNLGLNMH
jgi:type II secretory pathway pseudopilin PulG